MYTMLLRKQLTLEQTMANSQFYSLVIDSIEDAKVENGKISIAVNFTSEQIVGENEESVVKK